MADGSEGNDDRSPMGRYILVNHVPVPEPDLHTWAKWMGTGDNRRVKLYDAGSWRVSTVFLGLDYNFHAEGPPILFETMVFFFDKRREEKEHKDVFMWRYDTWDKSLLGHSIAVRTVNQIRSHVLHTRVWEQLTYDVLGG